MPSTYDDTRGPENDSGWHEVKVGKPPQNEKVNVWLTIQASPRSMGMGDSFEVPEAWLDVGKWFHIHKGAKTEIYADYVTHWRYARVTGASPPETDGDAK